MTRFLGLLAAFTFFAAPSSAATIAISGVTASSTFFTYSTNSLINGSGISGGLHDGDFNNKWMSDLDDTAPSLLFDLGNVFTLSNTTIWNYGGGCCDAKRNATSVAVSMSIDNVAFGPAFTTALTNVTSDLFAGDTFELSGSARYIRFNLLGNYGATHTGLSEVQFQSAPPAVPEPATWAMMMIGFGGVGYSLRRKQKVNARVRFI